LIDIQAAITRCDDLIAPRGATKVLWVDHGPEFLAHALSEFCDELGVTLWCTIPGSPWRGGNVESFNGRLRDEMVNGELFESISEAQLLLDRWHVEDNEYRPQSSLGVSLPRSSRRSLLLKSGGDFEQDHNDRMLDGNSGRWEEYSQQRQPKAELTETVDHLLGTP
jgi:transposase InsO family protein